MLKGFTRPFTPRGTASIVEALPWKFAGDLILFHFKTDPKAIAAYLPDPLRQRDQSGEAFMWSPRLCAYPVGADPLQRPPAQSYYNVCVLGLPAVLNGQRTLYSTFQWCDRDWLVLLSWMLGACSKLGQFDDSGVHPLLATQGVGQTGDLGTVFRRTLSRYGERVVTMSLRIEEDIELDDMQFYFEALPLTSMRHLPGCDPSDPRKPLVHDLTQMVMSNVSFGQPSRGTGELVFHDAENEELLPLSPHEVIAGYRMPMAFTLEGVRSVHNYLA